MAKKKQEVNTDSLDCPECERAVEVPSSEDSKVDQMEVQCPHCDNYLVLDKVCYWDATQAYLT